MNCPACNKNSSKVIYLGFPMYFCQHCTTMFGFWSWIPCVWYNGSLFYYNGNYLKALCHYLKGE